MTDEKNGTFSHSINEKTQEYVRKLYGILAEKYQTLEKRWKESEKSTDSRLTKKEREQEIEKNFTKLMLVENMKDRLEDLNRKSSQDLLQLFLELDSFILYLQSVKSFDKYDRPHPLGSGTRKLIRQIHEKADYKSLVSKVTKILSGNYTQSSEAEIPASPSNRLFLHYQMQIAKFFYYKKEEIQASQHSVFSWSSDQEKIERIRTLNLAAPLLKGQGNLDGISKLLEKLLDPGERKKTTAQFLKETLRKGFDPKVNFLIRMDNETDKFLKQMRDEIKSLLIMKQSATKRASGSSVSTPESSPKDKGEILEKGKDQTPSSTTNSIAQRPDTPRVSNATKEEPSVSTLSAREIKTETTISQTPAVEKSLEIKEGTQRIEKDKDETQKEKGVVVLPSSPIELTSGSSHQSASRTVKVHWDMKPDLSFLARQMTQTVGKGKDLANKKIELPFEIEDPPGNNNSPG